MQRCTLMGTSGTENKFPGGKHCCCEKHCNCNASYMGQALDHDGCFCPICKKPQRFFPLYQELICDDCEKRANPPRSAWGGYGHVNVDPNTWIDGIPCKATV